LRCRAEVLDVARRTAERIDRLLRERGRSLERDGDEPEPELSFDEPRLASCYAAAAQGISVSGERAGLPQLRLVFGRGPAPERAEACAGRARCRCRAPRRQRPRQAVGRRAWPAAARASLPLRHSSSTSTAPSRREEKDGPGSWNMCSRSTSIF